MRKIGYDITYCNFTSQQKTAWRSGSPRNGAPLTVEISQTGFAQLREQHVHDFGNGLLDGERRVRSAKSGADPTRSHQHQCARLSGMTRGVAPHELVQSGLASAIDFDPALFVVADAPLS